MYIYEVSVTEKEHNTPQTHYFTSLIKCERFIKTISETHDVICELEKESVFEKQSNKYILSKYQLKGMDTNTTYINITVASLIVN